MIKLLKDHKLFFASFFLALCVGSFLRLYRLSDFPDGMHFDEAWYGYNAFLLLKSAKNIYGEFLPYSVDFFGDYVSAMHAYLTAPFVQLFGLNVFSIRITMVIFSLLVLLAGCWLAWLLTKNKTIVVIFVWLLALSPWHIIMSRASSTVIVDSFMLTMFLSFYFLYVQKVFQSTDIKIASLFKLGSISYLFALLGYMTYFTSRLLIVPMAIGLWSANLQTGVYLKSKKILISLLPLIIYLIFPFAVLLPTPFATGRFSQTKIINHPQVWTDLENQYIRSTQGHAPIWLMRAFHNKITQNGLMIWKQYITFLSPDTLLSQIEHPPRYQVPNVSVLTPLELLGIVISIVVGLIGIKSSLKPYAKTALITSVWVLIAILPAALTVDDFPNFQRSVIATPFWQISSAVGLWILFTSLKDRFKARVYLYRLALLGAVLIFASGGVWFWYQYTVQAPYYEPYYRNTVGTQIAHWINANAHDAKILGEEKDGYFLLTHFFAGENVLDWNIKKPGKYFMIYPEEFEIGQRKYVQQLCKTDKIFTHDYDYAILSVKDNCPIPWWTKVVYSAKYKNDTNGLVVLSADSTIKPQLKSLWQNAQTEQEKKDIVSKAWSVNKPSPI